MKPSPGYLAPPYLCTLIAAEVLQKKEKKTANRDLVWVFDTTVQLSSEHRIFVVIVDARHTFSAVIHYVSHSS